MTTTSEEIKMAFYALSDDEDPNNGVGDREVGGGSLDSDELGSEGDGDSDSFEELKLKEEEGEEEDDFGEAPEM